MNKASKWIDLIICIIWCIVLGLSYISEIQGNIPSWVSYRIVVSVIALEYFLKFVNYVGK
jgi:uncharacterized protein (DUF983 family)